MKRCPNRMLRHVSWCWKSNRGAGNTNQRRDWRLMKIQALLPGLPPTPPPFGNWGWKHRIQSTHCLLANELSLKARHLWWHSLGRSSKILAFKGTCKTTQDVQSNRCLNHEIITSSTTTSTTSTTTSGLVESWFLTTRDDVCRPCRPPVLTTRLTTKSGGFLSGKIDFIGNENQESGHLKSLLKTGF